MTDSSKGQPNRCPVCSQPIKIEPSTHFGDASCPRCGSLLWFIAHDSGILYFEEKTAAPIRDRLRQILSEQLGISVEKIRLDGNALGADSLDTVELIMELEEEFDITFPGDDDGGGQPPPAVLEREARCPSLSLALRSSRRSQTTMRDSFDFTSPLGPLGRFADWLFLTKYMRRLLQIRNQLIKTVAESGDVGRFIAARR